MNILCAHTNIDILPQEDIPLSGFYKRDSNAPFIGIEECRLKIAWIKFPNQESLIFLLADYLFFPNELAENCLSFLKNSFDISASNIILAGTHNHSGPALGFLPWENQQPNYLATVFEKIKSAFSILETKLEEATMSVGKAKTGSININRRKPIYHWRKFFKRSAFMLPNPKGPTNHLVHGIKINYKSGASLALLSMASHPVFNRNLKNSSDYPGLLSASLIKNKWANEVFLFQGFGGDIRPNYQKRKDFLHRIKAVFYGNDFARYSPTNANDFVEKISASLKKVDWKSSQPSNGILSTTTHLALRSKTLKHKHKLSIKKIAINSEINILTANAEMFVEYENCLPSNYFPISCTHNCIGYVPRSKDLPLGGYEVDESPLNNGADAAYLKEDILAVESHFDSYSKNQ